MIEIDVSRRLGEFQLDVAFSTDTQGITALFGRSGAGKTCIVNMLAGLLTPDRGRIAVNGQVLFDSAARLDVPPERRRLGYVFQESRLFPHLNVRGNLEYGMRLVPRRERRITFDEVVEMLGIGALLTRRPHRLSGGEKQRVTIGRALLTSPRLLLMDEPLASLDGARKNEILPFIERLSDHFAVPIVYVTHAMDEIIRLADTLVLVSDGSVAATGAVEDLTSRFDLRPLTGRYEAGSVIATHIAGHDDRYGLTLLEFAGGTFSVPRIEASPGTSIRVRVRARDVALALSRPADSSFANVFEGTVTEISAPMEDESGAQIDIKLDIGLPLWSRITRRSLDELGIALGSRVFALVKGTSIDRYNQARFKAEAAEDG